MRFLIDNALSPSIAKGLNTSGYNAVHVREIGMASATDFVIMNHAINDNRIIVSADTDFGTLLALRVYTKPSFVLFRMTDKRPSSLLNHLLVNLGRIKEDLEKEAIVVIEDNRIRVRKLPIITTLI